MQTICHQGYPCLIWELWSWSLEFSFSLKQSGTDLPCLCSCLCIKCVPTWKDTGRLPGSQKAWISPQVPSMCTLDHLFYFARLACGFIYVGGCWCRAAAYSWYRACSNLLQKMCGFYIFPPPGSFHTAVATGSLNRAIIISATWMFLLPKGSKSTLKSRENVAIMYIT